MILPLYCVLVRPHLKGSCIQLSLRSLAWKRHLPVGESLEATKPMRGLEHFCYEDRLRDIGDVQPEADKAPERPYWSLFVFKPLNLTKAFFIIKQMRSDFLQQIVLGQGAMIKLKEEKFGLDFRSKLTLRGWWGTGTEKLWMPHSRKCSRPDWIGLWATWTGEWHPRPWEGARLRLDDPFQSKPCSDSKLRFRMPIFSYS